MNQILPSKYYLNHAYELFDFVAKQCESLLSDEHKNYLQGISALSEDARCLLIRCLARKPYFIKLSSLSYDEINDIGRAVDELQRNNYLRFATHDDWIKLSQLLTKPQLVKSLVDAPIKIKSSTKKAELVDHAQQYVSGKEAHLSSLLSSMVVKQRGDLIEYIFFLFFGDIRNRFQQFAMRDLGVMKTRKEAKNVARFEHIAEAQSAFELQKRRRDFSLNPSELKEQTADYLIGCNVIGHSAKETYDRLLLNVGNQLADSDAEKAITLWKMSDEPAATEKWVRESYTRFDRDDLHATLLKMREADLSPRIKVFIEDFYARKYQAKRTSIFTDMLREASNTIPLDEAFTNDVEDGVIAHYRQCGIDAYFTENKFWRVLFALTFWDLLFGPQQTQFSEFDRLPTQLKNNSFYTLQNEKIEQCLALFSSHSLSDKKTLLSRLTQRSAIHYGKPNGLFNWSPGLLDTIQLAITHDTAPALAMVLRRMAKHYANTKDGYPDLMVIENRQLRFEEIKAPGDVLRANQLVSINRLRSAGIKVNLTQIEWATNPEQTYAVVDIETTGGRKGGNAITEIAVVQVRAQEIVSEWSSLVNPQRHIPAHITRLTGIDNAMVASAPIFAEIADLLEQQLEGAIFVAHNVGFDYGFIKAAYESINRSFKKPKFCTVSNSRKSFPGLKSYSLGALTEHFDIDLVSHHRALSDAKATADLLRLIQETRQSQSIA
ncbi:MAG: VRR-NUC domain-containing protein [Arenicella sp.]|nr:VRR-NUC domain-containing protein [Arenicella sp.]